MTSKEELIAKGWESIGFDGVLEYLARGNEHGSIQFVPVADGKTLGIIESHNKELISLLYRYISK